MHLENVAVLIPALKSSFPLLSNLKMPLRVFSSVDFEGLGIVAPICGDVEASHQITDSERRSQKETGVSGSLLPSSLPCFPKYWACF